MSELMISVWPGELWWGGAVADGKLMPFEGGAIHERDLATQAGPIDTTVGGGNQSAPLLISNRGRAVWSQTPFRFRFAGDDTLAISGGDVEVEEFGDNLAAAYRGASDRYFPPSGTTVDELFFTAPVYNTWIETPYRPTQESVLRYARDVVDHGFPPGVIMIDDLWALDYGVWRFNPTQFPDPAGMCDELHALGFAVMVWLVPFVSPDSATSRELDAAGLLLRTASGEPSVHRWWNGFSTALDLTNPDTLVWLRGQLADLVDLGVDGFKLDAGDLAFYGDEVSFSGGKAVDQCEAWARVGLDFAFNEMRACWKLGGQALMQRQHDKPQAWGPDGLALLIPEGIAQSLLGYAYHCPDMVGGGLASSFEGREIDQELFVRYAQVAALFPVMQFSLVPWRVLDAEHLAAVSQAVAMRQQHVAEIVELARTAAKTGEPILRPLAYHYPGYDRVPDQFLLGADLLVAPVLQQGATSRAVQIPPGRWRSEVDDTVVDGPTQIVVNVDLNTLPRWRRASTQS